MLLGFKTELRLNNKQRTALAKHAGVARHAWNWGLGLTKQILDHNQDNPEDKIKFPTAIDLHKWLVALIKPKCPWYYEVSKCAPQYALRQLAESWKRAFKKTSKPPRFKRKGKHDRFTLDGSIQLDHFKIRVPVIGWLRTYERLPVRFQVAADQRGGRTSDMAPCGGSLAKSTGAPGRSPPGATRCNQRHFGDRRCGEAIR